MSRYVRLALPAAERVDVASALAAMGLEFEQGDVDEPLPLRGSLECAPEPVDFKLAAGALGSVEDFGIVLASSPSGEVALELTCGDVDRTLLERELLPRLGQELRAHQSMRLLKAQGLHCRIERDGTQEVRVVVERGG